VFHGGYNFGGEDLDKGWGEYIWPQEQSGGVSTQARFSDGFVRSFITRDPNFDTLRWNPNDWLPELNIINALFEAFDPDLSGMLAHGAKLVMWNGALDTSVSARDSGQYYDRVVATLGQKNADAALELFIEPGVGHCGGGPGPDQLDWFKAMTEWVEKGVPPSRQKLVLARNEAQGKPKLQRPLCKYPRYAAYRGSGDINDAASFECAAPGPNE
jgi:feruloyl esterase